MSAIGVGVVGLGFMGRTHVACYRDAKEAGLPCRLVAVADGDADRRAGLGADAGNISTGAQAERIFDPSEVTGYETHEGLFADDSVDLVSICTPTPTHVDLALAAIDAGKHVLIEKPLALTSAEARRVAEAARATDRIVMPGMCIRFWPAYAWVREKIRSGEFGPVRSATFHRLGSTPAWADFYADASRSGGALLDLHIHDADFVQFCFGRPSAVASTGTLNHVSTNYIYDDGPSLVVGEGGWGHQTGFGYKMRFVVTFDEVTVDFDLDRDPALRISRGDGSEPVALDTLNGYDLEIRHLIRCIAEGRTPEVTCEHGVEAIELLESERASLETRAPVTL